MLKTRIGIVVLALAIAIGQVVALGGTAAATTPPSAPTISFATPSISGSAATVAYSVNRAAQQIRSVACSITPKGGSAASATCGSQTASSSKSTSYSATLTNLGAGTYTYTVTVKMTDGGSGTSSVPFTIKGGVANCTVTPYTANYDGNPHTATGSCTGAGGVALPASDLNLTGTTHTNAGSYATDHWSFADPTGNYTNPGGTLSDSIGQATASCTVSSYSVTFDGNAHTASGSCTGVNGVALPASDLNLSGTTHTNAATYATDHWSFIDPSGNYTNPGGTITDTISHATATCTVSSYSVTFDGNAHSATGSCSGVGGVALPASDLNLTGTTHTSAGTYATDHWSFTDPSGNYTNPGGTVSDSIGQATASCTVSSYSVTFDGNAHTATGSCTGVGGVALPASDLDLGNTTHTNAGSHNDAWSFADANYTNPGGTVTDSIGQATATCNVSSYSVTFDANSHTATGTCSGVGGTDLSSGLDLSRTTHTTAGTYASDAWSFTDSSGNYTNPGGTVSDAIAQATAVCTVTPYSATYNGASSTATGSCTGVGNADLSADLDLTGTTHTNVGSYATDHWSFADPAGNYTNPGGTITDVIIAPLPAIAVIHVNFPDDPQVPVIPPADVHNCPRQDPDNGGCQINELDGTIDNVFDASSSIDPNVDPTHDTVQYHWQIFYPPVFGQQVLYSAQGISGYHTPVLHIAAGSLPELDGDPRVGTDIYWRVELTITVNGYTGTVVFFRFSYSSDFSLDISTDCQLSGQFMGQDCSVIAPQLLPSTDWV